MKVNKDSIVLQIDLLYEEMSERVLEIADMRNQVEKSTDSWTGNDMTQIQGVRRDALMIKEQIRKIRVKTV